MLGSPDVDCRYLGLHVQDRAESTAVSVDLTDTDSSLDGMLAVGRRPELHCAVRSNVSIHTAPEVRGEVSRMAGIGV
jgi:hypothetical protein